MANPYQPPAQVIQGDPVQALIAQLNRFASVDNVAPFTSNVLDTNVSLRALNLLRRQAETAKAGGDPSAQDLLNELSQPLTIMDPRSYISARIAQTTHILANYGDSLKLPTAKVGITTRDPRFQKKWGPWKWALAIAGIGAATIGAGIAAQRITRSA